MFLKEDETARLAEIAVYTAQVKDDRGFLPTAELENIVKWADAVRMQQALLENVLAGAAFIRWDEAKNDVTFALTPNGMASAEQALRRAGVLR